MTAAPKQPMPAAATHTEDWLLGGRVRLRQPASGYRAAIDPVFMAAALQVPDEARVLDLGCGVGTAALCLMARCPTLDLTGLELQPELALLAQENADINNFSARFAAICGDLRTVPWSPAGFDCVMLNPAFHPAGRSRPAADPARALAVYEGDTPLALWFETALSALKPRGHLATVIRADRLEEVLALLQDRAGAVVIHPLWPKAGRAAKRVVITARKDLRSPLQLRPGLVVHEADGDYSPEAAAVLRQGRALSGE